MTCETCKGKGLVLASLHQFGLGEGFAAFMRAGLGEPIRGDDGSCHYEIVCPACDGRGGDEDRGEGTT